MRLASCLAFLTLFLASTVAVAGPARTADDDADAAARRGTPAGKTQEFIYDPEELAGDSLHPDHERVDFRPPGKHPSLIQVRANFIPQLLRMANDV